MLWPFFRHEQPSNRSALQHMVNEYLLAGTFPSRASLVVFPAVDDASPYAHRRRVRVVAGRHGITGLGHAVKQVGAVARAAIAMSASRTRGVGRAIVEVGLQTLDRSRE